jgi:hypothetical protein
MGRLKKQNSKAKTIQIRLSKAEYNSYKFRTREFQKHFGVKINTSEFLRLALSKVDNLEFLMSVGYLSYFDVMDATLFNRTKYKRLHNAKHHR